MRLGNVIKINPESVRNDYPFNEIEYIDISSVGTGTFKGSQQLELAKAPSRAKRIVRNHDTLLATVRPNLRSFLFVRNPQRNTVASTGFAVLRAGKDIDARFLYFTVTNQPFTDYLTANVKGSAYPAVDTNTIERAEIYLPPLPTQHKIASILSAHDELIENNTRRIKILEELAQSIYREWFVNYRFPGHEKVKMVDSPLGMIPEGWCARYEDCVDYLEGPGLRNWQYRSTGMPFLNIRTLKDNDIDTPKLQYLDVNEVESKYKHFLLKPYDHVVSSSGTIGRLVTIQAYHLPLMLNTSIIRMKPKTRILGKWLLKHFLKSDYFQVQIRAHASGVAQMNFGPSHLRLMNFLLPTENLCRDYEDIVEPVEELICNLTISNRNLRQTRDFLLPRLISGELDVSDLDIQVPQELS